MKVSATPEWLRLMYPVAVLALLAALSASALSLALRLVLGVQLLPELLLGRIVQLMPVALFSWGIRNLEGSAKPLLFASLLLTEVVLLSLLGFWWLRSRSPRRLPGLLLLIAALYGVQVLVLMPLFGLGLLGAGTPRGIGAAAGPLLTLCAWGIALYGARSLLCSAEDAPSSSRRRAMLAGGVWTVCAVVGVATAGWALLGRASLTRLGAAPRRTSAITPTEEFYQVSKNVLDPVVDRDSWRLRLDGEIERELEWTLEELRALPATEQIATMECISNPVGGNLISTGVWKGVRLADLLQQVGVREGAYDVVCRCADGYTESLEVAHALSPEVLLVYELNGAPLDPKHGQPLRLQVPGRYGIKSAKWLESLRVVREDYLGYWQTESNWTDTALVHTECRIDSVPGGRVTREGTTLTGVAYTGTKGVSRVEVSTDGGQTWADAVLEPELSPLAWRLWRYPWRPPAPGTYSVDARAYDGQGLPQAVSQNVPRARGVPLEGTLVTGEVGIHRLALTVSDV